MSHCPSQRVPSTKQRLDNGSVEDHSSESESSDNEDDLKKTQQRPKRVNKHAPVEVTSKKPVTRRRSVVEANTPKVRDPRFLPLAGTMSKEKFQANYSFLGDAHVSELRTLRENLKRARKRLSSAPQELREECEEEIGRLELAVKRAESAVNRDKREKVENAALAKVTTEERQKRKEGKRGWWMKTSAKKDLLLKARYEALASEGGRQAVQKAVEKRQRKVTQKEKKSRALVDGPRKRQRIL